MMKAKGSHRPLTVLIILTLALIWGHSLLGREASSEESGFVMELLEPDLEMVVGEGNVTEFLVRKLAHFTEFFVLGLELLTFFAYRKPLFPQAFLLALTHGFFAAFLDETIQIFSGRGPMIQDVWLDVSGFAVGSLLMLGIMVWRKHRKNNPS
jgi:VanZ family protein